MQKSLNRSATGLQYQFVLCGLVSICCNLCLASEQAGHEPSQGYQLVFEQSAFTDVLQLQGRDSRWQLQVTKISADGRETDVTRQVTYRIEAPLAEVDQTGFLRPLEDGSTRIVVHDDHGQSAALEINVDGMEQHQPVNFPNQIVPIFTKLGCNGGGCHGKAAGQAGFKLSLLGFEPQEDYDHLVHESRGRRLFPTIPDRSLLLEKAINSKPHGGGQRLSADSHEYRLLRRWIASGMPFGAEDDPVVTRIEVLPRTRTLNRGSFQQLSTVAHFSDGHTEDITRTAQYETNNSDLANVDERGAVTLLDRTGDVAVMVRYQGQVAVFRATIPLGVETSDLAHLPDASNWIDDRIFAKLEKLGIPPSPVCDDSTWIRRLALDLTGRLPTVEETREFLADDGPSKYGRAVDRLLGTADHADYFARKWVAILRNRRDNSAQRFGSFAFHDWLRESFFDNVPYDQFVRELLTASGAISANPAVTWWREVNNTESRVEDAAQLFLGQRLQCARCHHHPFEKWSQKDYFQMAAFFSKVRSKEGEVPEEPVFTWRIGGASAKHPKTGAPLKPAGLDAPELNLPPQSDPRDALVDWMVAPENPFFARSLVNRYWKHFFAVGFVEPIDDIRVTNPPTDPELLDALAAFFVDNNFDTRALLRLICTSTTYRLSSDTNSYNLIDTHSYSRFYPKRLQAEVLLDVIDQVAMTTSAFDGMPAGTRAVSLPDTGFASYFLDVFGEPNSSTACECERSSEATLAQSLHLLNSKEIQTKLRSDAGWAAAAASSSQPSRELLEELYLRALSRPPTDAELQVATEYLRVKSANPRAAWEDLLWAIINTKEFLFNH